MYIPDLDMDLVRCFVAVAENGGFTAAGKRLNLSQSAVSLKIQRLENLLERRVFSRTSRSLELTAEGEILLNYAGRLLALNREILERIGEPAIEAIVRVGVVEYFGQQFLPGLLAQFKQGRPNVRLSVEVGMSQDLVNALAEGKFDFVIATAGKIPSSEVKMENVTQERILITEPLVWAQAITSPINPQIDPVPLVLIASPCSYRRIALEALEKRGRPWQIVYTSSSLGSIQSAVLAGLGITICGRSSVLAGMKVVDYEQGLPKLPKTSIAIYSRQSVVEPLAKHLAAFIIKAVDRWESEFTLRTPVAAAAFSSHNLSDRKNGDALHN
jgi:DNA-binding transcriptional LysR family regulator